MQSRHIATKEEFNQLKSYVEASIDPLEFFKHVKILDSTTNAIIPYELWPHLKYVIKAIYRFPLVIILKGKQLGISWAIAGIARHICFKTGGNVLDISSGKDAAADLLGKSRFIESYLPKNLQLEKEHDGSTLLGFKRPHSRILSLASTEDAGVGQTASLVLADENEFHEYARENYGQLKPTIDAGAHMVVVSTSDPLNINSNFKILWRGAREGDYYPIPGVNLKVNKGERPGPNGFFPIFLGYDVRPGRDEQWYEKTSKTYPLEWQFRAAYPRTEEEALSPLTGRSVFDKQILTRLLSETCEGTVRQGAITIYLGPQIGVHYIAGADIAEGRGGDYSVLWIEGQQGLQRELCAVIHSNHIAPDTFAYMSYELLREYYSPLVIGGDDAFGGTYLKYLVDLGYPRAKIYCSDKKKEKLGYRENENTQQTDILALEVSIRGGLKVRYKPAILEMFAYQWGETKGVSKAEPAKGAHNDLIMAAAKANWGFKKFGFSGEIRPVVLTGEKAVRTFVRT